MIWRCDLLPQYEAYKEEILEAVRQVLASGRYILADHVRAFEREFAEFVGTTHGVGVANATDGLTLSLLALGIGGGDEVITTPFTAIPTVSAIIDSGATPVFVDICPDTFLMDLDKVEPAITPRTKAIMPVHIFGNVVDIPKLRGIAGPNLAVIEDASQAHGSTLDGRQCGSMGTAGVFSFYPTKNLGGYGDGGIVVTNDATLAEKIRLLRMYGMVDKDHIVINGINSRLDELQAAILRVKLRHLEEMNRLRNVVADRYIKELRSDLLTHQRIVDGACSNYHVFVSRVTQGRRQRLIEYLDRHDIQTNIYYVLPLHLQQALVFLGKRVGDFPIAEGLCEDVLALPFYPELGRDLQSHIISVIDDFA